MEKRPTHGRAAGRVVATQEQARRHGVQHLPGRLQGEAGLPAGGLRSPVPRQVRAPLVQRGPHALSGVPLGRAAERLGEAAVTRKHARTVENINR